MPYVVYKNVLEDDDIVQCLYFLLKQRSDANKVEFFNKPLLSLKRNPESEVQSLQNVTSLIQVTT